MRWCDFERKYSVKIFLDMWRMSEWVSECQVPSIEHQIAEKQIQKFLNYSSIASSTVAKGKGLDLNITLIAFMSMKYTSSHSIYLSIYLPLSPFLSLVNKCKKSENKDKYRHSEFWIHLQEFFQWKMFRGIMSVILGRTEPMIWNVHRFQSKNLRFEVQS